MSGRNESPQVRVLTNITYDAALLPHFVAYYRELGVHAFAVSIFEQRPGI